MGQHPYIAARQGVMRVCITLSLDFEHLGGFAIPIAKAYTSLSGEWRKGRGSCPANQTTNLFIKTHDTMDGSGNLNLLSKHRSFIMGIAMMMIMLHHLYFVGFPCNTLALDYGMLGVDIFLLLSGFGIYFSLAKNWDKPIGSFYRRRLVRIFPAAILAGILVTIPSGSPTCQHWSLA